jgi:hypothetical protein
MLPGGQRSCLKASWGSTLAGERLFLYARAERLLTGGYHRPSKVGHRNTRGLMTPVATPGEPNRFALENDIVINEIL